MPSIIEQALIIIGFSVFFVPIFRRLGLGSVLGYLIAGILIGPHVLRLVEDSSSMKEFADLGVVLLLFVIGLEIHPSRLWQMRRNLLGMGGLQVLVSTAIFTGVACYIGLAPVTAIVVGFALSLSSTAVALQTLTERNQLNSEFGRTSFAVLLMQDLMAIPALALIPALAKSGGAKASITTIIIFIPIFIVVLSLVSRFVLRPAFRLIAASRTREIFTAATLFIVLGIAMLMQKVGLSAALGTFIAGVLLADSEYRHELEANLEPFKGLLMGLFFISVGAGVNLKIIMADPFSFVVLAIAYLVVKMIIVYAIARLFKMSHENGKLTAMTVGQGGEFAFVIFSMIIAYNLAPPPILMIFTAIITLSMALHPLVYFIDERIVRYRKIEGVKPTYDEIKGEDPEVIIAGFGRFGQIFARVLRTQHIPFVAIDHDSDQIEFVRKYGNKVYYGDVLRSDLLEAAGAAKAKYFVLAVDDVEVSLSAARLVRDTFPNLKIFARARNRGHAFDLMELGIKFIKRETFDSSAFFAGELLGEMGVDPARVRVLTDRFRRHDELMMLDQFKVRSDDKEYISQSQQAMAQFEQVLRDEENKTYIEPGSKEELNL